MPGTGAAISCVFPAYNEADNLPHTIAEWDRALAGSPGAYELIVVDDGSTDDTQRVLASLGRRFPMLRVVTHERNRGYGMAIANGFAHAAHPFVCFTDADGQYDPTDLSALLARTADADLVAGYRAPRADPGLRLLLSDGYNRLARLAVGVPLRDLNCAFKVMPRDAFVRLGVEAPGFMVNADLVLRACRAGWRIAEVPVRHRPRRAGRSTVRPIHVLAGLVGLVRLRLRSGRATPR